MKPADRLPVVASITCYHDPGYIRTRTLNAALERRPDIELVSVVNTRTGFLRYPEIVRLVLRVRRQRRPDVYLVNFRGYEILALVLAVAGRRPVIFDEFVNPMLVVREHRMNKRGLVRILMGLADHGAWAYHALIRRCAAILTDTPAHARYSANESGIEPARYQPVPVGADESVFAPAPASTITDRTRVFFYSTGSQPLHGMPVILDAAVHLGNRPDIEFVIAGHKGGIGQQIAVAQARGAQITHHEWIPFDELSATISGSDLCLGGPFGGTPQAQLVITGKTFQFLACQVATVIGASPATALFTDRLDALVVPQNDADALAAAIAWAADNPVERAAIARAGRATYERELGTAKVSAALDRVFDPVIAGTTR